jgi:hypothetical protein
MKYGERHEQAARRRAVARRDAVKTARKPARPGHRKSA